MKLLSVTRRYDLSPIYSFKTLAFEFDAKNELTRIWFEGPQGNVLRGSERPVSALNNLSAQDLLIFVQLGRDGRDIPSNELKRICNAILA